ncbi:hypothetical protein, partial [Turicimonas muris]
LFSQIVAGTLRIMAVNPDKVVAPKTTYVKNDSRQQVKDKSLKTVVQGKAKKAASQPVSNKTEPVKKLPRIRAANDVGKGLKKETGGA